MTRHARPSRCQAVQPWLYLSLALSLVLPGCAVAPLVKVREPVRMGSFEVSSPIEWSQFGINRMRTWTLDGPDLNHLMFYVDIKDREHVFLQLPTARQRRKGEGALYRAGISESEAVELIADGLSAYGLVTPKIEKVSPAQFGAQSGFSFELSFATERGLRYQAIGIGEIQQNTLSYALYYAPSEYYFTRNKADVEAVFRSIRSVE